LLRKQADIRGLRREIKPGRQRGLFPLCRPRSRWRDRQRLKLFNEQAAAWLREQEAFGFEQIIGDADGLFADAQMPAQLAPGGDLRAAREAALGDVPRDKAVQLLVSKGGRRCPGPADRSGPS